MEDLRVVRIGGLRYQTAEYLKDCCDGRFSGLMQCIMERLAGIAIAFTMHQ
jgi:hypothetical protein